MGRFFHIDPLLLLQGDYFEWATRVAAYNVAIDHHNAEQEEEAKKAKARR